MEAKSKQENYQCKLARDMHNFHHGGGNRFNAYGGNNYGNGNFTPRRHVGVGNFSSYAKSFEHTSYDDYGGYGRVNTKYDYYERSPYDYYEEYHHSYEFSKVNELPQATIEVEESATIHAKEEISKVERCDLMRKEHRKREH
ncbi:hypothetical protein M9H77_02936 [Catharanthus roseus]|uniref:Uncharacterized protein n=1 Tax=Catharanthus roseus TaxID=4058 RepID=A0ACC0CA86_CATRO|nr:hypothetical protein M9H77_02936 [Catharanthus roseus]